MIRLVLFGLSLMMVGCTGSEEHLSEGFGDAVRHNMAAQIIDPDPVYPGPVLLDGARGALALERYRTGEVIPPVDLRTSTFDVQSGN